MGCAHRNTILRIDKMIQKATRAWLRLPKDTSLGFLHSPVKSGGLGVPSLGTTIPLLQRRRFEKLLTSECPFERMLTELPSFQTTLRRINLPCRVGRETVCSSTEAKAEWERVWRTSADGRSGVNDDTDPASYTWVSKPNRVFPRLHLRGVQLRGGTLNIKARASRGREKPPNDLACRGACHTRKTLNHILQICEITHDASWRRCRGEKLNEHGLSPSFRLRGASSNQTFLWTQESTMILDLTLTPRRARPACRTQAICGCSLFPLTEGLFYLVDPASNIDLHGLIFERSISTQGRYSETANGSLNQLWSL